MSENINAWIEEQTGGIRYGCIILVNGNTVAEWYGGGFTDQSIFEIGSIRKSFNCALVGPGIRQGTIDLDVEANDIWPEIVKLSGDDKDRGITLHHLMSGTSGWLTPDPPGLRFLYNNAAFTAAERVVARIYGLPHDETAPEVRRRFKESLKANSWTVYHFERDFDPKKHSNPGPKLAIDSNLRDLVKWGQLWLDNGKYGDGQLIPAEHIKRSTQPVNPNIPEARYGYNWFLNRGRDLWPDAPPDSYGHPGFGTFRPSGEASRAYLWICPSLNTVAGIVADASVGFGSDHLDVPNGLTAEWIGMIVRSM